ncbi:MAG: ribosome silencing factor [Alphaproteobacteria bacterium]|nr:ribosome silencing factor [Alphaproteobacteria bacterium]
MKSTQITRSSKLFKTAINAIENKKGENIVSLDLKNIPDCFTNFFIICSATSNVQIKAIADEIKILISTELKEKPYCYHGKNNENWIILDYVTLVIHIMHPEQRSFYKLEELWRDSNLKKH